MSEHPEDIDFLARYAYEQGTDPVTYAEGYVTQLLEVHLLVWAVREDEPGAFPGYCIDLTLGAVARRIIGTLMAAGWKPPEVPEGPVPA
jgi:hypothetical protein